MGDELKTLSFIQHPSLTTHYLFYELSEYLFSVS
jgi:hypothetical protein